MSSRRHHHGGSYTDKTGELVDEDRGASGTPDPTSTLPSFAAERQRSGGGEGAVRGGQVFGHLSGRGGGIGFVEPSGGGGGVDGAGDDSDHPSPTMSWGDSGLSDMTFELDLTEVRGRGFGLSDPFTGAPWVVLRFLARRREGT